MDDIISDGDSHESNDYIMNDMPYLLINYAYLPESLLATVNFDFVGCKDTFFKETEMAVIDDINKSPTPN